MDGPMLIWMDYRRLSRHRQGGVADRPAGIRPTIGMEVIPDNRRFRVSGGTYFFTVNLFERRQDTLVRHVDSLR